MYSDNLSWRELVRNIEEQIELSKTYLDFYHSILKAGGPVFPWGPIYHPKTTLLLSLEQILLFIRESHKTGIADKFNAIKNALETSDNLSLETYETLRSLLISSIKFAELEQLLQIAVNQRVTNTQTSEIQRIGGAALYKVFSACEGLVLDYYNLLIGSPSVGESRIRFATIFGATSVFQVRLLRRSQAIYGMEGIGFINLPEYAFHRVRFWPALAHEISHFFAGDFLLNPQDDRLRLKLNAFTNTIRGVLVNIVQDPFALRDHALKHTEELLSDILATLVAGPSYTQTILSLMPYENAFYAPLSSHPPMLVRGRLSSEVLRFMEFRREADRARKEVDEVVKKFKRTAEIERPQHTVFLRTIWQFLTIYSESVESYMPELCEIFTARSLRSRFAIGHRMKVKSLDANRRRRFKSIADQLKRNSIPSPIPAPNDLVNSVWHDRTRRKLEEQTRLTDICLWCMDRWYRQIIEKERR